jgi:hypothetical protein
LSDKNVPKSSLKTNGGISSTYIRVISTHFKKKNELERQMTQEKIEKMLQTAGENLNDQ